MSKGKRTKAKKKMKNSTKFIILLLLIIAIAGGILAYQIFTGNNSTLNNEENKEVASEPEPESEPEPVKQVQIYKGNDRPIAVMIDNHNGAWPQAGLNNAYMVYEIIVEGGETRLMALFKGQNLATIGPVRSSRHYFLDYAMENDAMYVHYGWSPQAQSDISKFGINNINGITESSDIFWRSKEKSSPHNAVTSTEKILKSANAKKYRTTSTKESVLNYTTDEVELTSETVANKVVIPHSDLQKVSYEYDAENKVYKRYARNKAQNDWTTGEAVKTKNIIITLCDNYTLSDGENKGRQGLKNIGTFNGYYITNGKAIKIQCTKSDRSSQTVYKDLDGNIINVNDGNTFVHICPTSAKISFE